MTQLQAHPAAGWYADPSGRHEARYWDGESWTDRVADRGVENADTDATSGRVPEPAQESAAAVTETAPTAPTAPTTTMVDEPVAPAPAFGEPAFAPRATAEPDLGPYAELAELRRDDPEPEPPMGFAGDRDERGYDDPSDDTPVTSVLAALAPYAPETVVGPQAGDPPIVADPITEPEADEAPEPEGAVAAPPEPESATTDYDQISRMGDSPVESPFFDEAPDPMADLFDDAPIESTVDSPVVSAAESATDYSPDSPVADEPAASSWDHVVVDPPIESTMPAEVPVDVPTEVSFEASAEMPAFTPPPVESVESVVLEHGFVDSPVDSPMVSPPVADVAVDPFGALPPEPAVEAWAPAPVAESTFDSPVFDSPAFDAPVLDAPPPVAPPFHPLSPMAPPAASVDLFAPPPPEPSYAAPPMETPAPAPAAPAAPEHGWYPDPMGRAEVRYWDGSRWTERVATNGVERMDAPVADILDMSVGAMATTDPSITSVPAAYDPDWYPDPTGRHEVRYFDGTTWTEHVANNGMPALDPIADGAPVAGAGAELAASIVPAVSTAASPNATTVEAAEKAFAAALAPAVETTEPEPATPVMPVSRDWAARPNALVGWIVVIGAGVLGIGSVGPWAKATAPVIGDVVQNGMSGDGRFMLVLAILLLGTGVGLIMGKLGRIVAFSALSLGTLAAIVCAVDMARISNGSYGLLQGTADATASAGIGLWACLVGAIVCIAGGIVAVTHR